MAESRAKRLQIVLTMSEKAESEAAKRVKKQVDLIHQEELQLKELNSYSQQYVQSYSERRDGVYAHEMINYSGFIHRLSFVIQEQENKILLLKRELEKLKGDWSIAHQKHKAMDELIERFKQDESLDLERRLQKELDELANRPNGLC